MKNPIQISWLDLPESQDYPAALSYLSLIFPVQIARQYIDKLQVVEISHFKAKDIFRSSRLDLL